MKKGKKLIILTAVVCIIGISVIILKNNLIELPEVVGVEGVDSNDTTDYLYEVDATSDGVVNEESHDYLPAENITQTQIADDSTQIENYTYVSK